LTGGTPVPVEGEGVVEAEGVGGGGLGVGVLGVREGERWKMMMMTTPIRRMIPELSLSQRFL
jgi:hypothetical protein